MSANLLAGPRWVAVRQHRRPLWTALGLLLVAVGMMLGSRLWADAAVEALRTTGCAVDSPGPRCFQAAREYTDSIWAARHLIEYTALGMIALPVVVGAFMAGPMIAREMETGTYLVAWSQSVSPARWLAAKLSVPLVAVVAGTVLLAQLFRWAWSTGPAHAFPTYWYEPTMYASIGAVPTASAVMGVAVGTLIGLLVRRTVVAMGVTALVTGTVLAVLAQTRAHLWPVRTLTGHDLPELPISRVWRVDAGVIGPSGERVSTADCYGDISQMPALCGVRGGKVTHYLDHHPGDHFWPIQLVETGIVLALAALATVLAFRVLRRHHA
ncbi:ABC transporter permease [Streptomyces sp. WAC05374]|uniref:ABC transporter permease n=1 Tax=Streptomyces sp. WAC05374 TaxID=2487420 RepID=UPI001F402C7B|nr:ABC transporter permease [Streptomyces sp. WAC05374]